MTTQEDAVIKVPANKTDLFFQTMYDHLVDALSKAEGPEITKERLEEIRAIAKAKTEDFLSSQLAEQRAREMIGALQ
jgi:hypothetical protein